MTYITEQGKLGNVKDDLEESRRKVKDLEKQLEDLFQYILRDLSLIKPPDCPAVQNRFHHFIHDPLTSFQH